MAKKILVIEDSDIIASMLQDNLEALGYEVTVAGSGTEGLARARQIIPDIITLDIMMSGLDGVEVLKQLKGSKKTKDIPVIIISIADSYREEGLKLGALAFLKKPVDFSQLDKKISSLTNKKRVLVVEDNQVISKIVETKLVSMGYEVIPAFDGNSAIGKSMKENPDIILIDALLSDEDGFSVIKKLKENPKTSSIPIITFSDHFSEDIDSEKIVGIEKFLGKNFSVEDLVKEVTEILKQA